MKLRKITRKGVNAIEADLEESLIVDDKFVKDGKSVANMFFADIVKRLSNRLRIGRVNRESLTERRKGVGRGIRGFKRGESVRKMGGKRRMRREMEISGMQERNLFF